MKTRTPATARQRKKEENKVRYLAILILFMTAFGAETLFAQDQAHIPAKGSPERDAILNALRSNPQEKFQVHFIKAHNGWAWVDTTPLDANGQATAEGGPNLLHLVGGKWQVQDLSSVKEDPNDPMGAEDA